jgi:hypothetical protein
LLDLKSRMQGSPVSLCVPDGVITRGPALHWCHNYSSDTVRQSAQIPDGAACCVGDIWQVQWSTYSWQCYYVVASSVCASTTECSDFQWRHCVVTSSASPGQHCEVAGGVTLSVPWP